MVSIKQRLEKLEKQASPKRNWCEVTERDGDSVTLRWWIDGVEHVRIVRGVSFLDI